MKNKHFSQHHVPIKQFSDPALEILFDDKSAGFGVCDPVFNNVVYFFIGSRDDLIKDCAFAFGASEDDIYSGKKATTFCTNKDTFVCIYRDEPEDIPSLFHLLPMVAHEISHVVHRMMESRGIDDEETRAYMIGYYTEKFLSGYANLEGGMADSMPIVSA